MVRNFWSQSRFLLHNFSLSISHSLEKISLEMETKVVALKPLPAEERIRDPHHWLRDLSTADLGFFSQQRTESTVG